jgi:carbon-monoxide dehydrogenase medium subunit
VKPGTFDYHRPRSVDEALALRASYGDEASLLAGGQSLIPMLNFRLARPSALIDLGGVEELAYVRERDGGVAIGAMARQRDVEDSPVARRLNPLIRETLQNVAHPVVRNRGTVVGSIAHADAAAELPALFAALDGQATVANGDGQRVVKGEELFVFHLTTSLQADEVVSEVWLPALAAATGYAFVESARRHGDYALAGVCATLELAPEGTIAHARLAYSGIAARPVRAHSAESALDGAKPDDEAFQEASRLATGLVERSGDLVAPEDYRRHLVQRLTIRALATAARRAKERN